MAELVGEALLSGFLSVLFDRLASREVLEIFPGKEIISMKLDELEAKMLSVNALLTDAEMKQLTNQNVKVWLDKLKEVIYEVDHVMDKINTEALPHKIEGGDQSGSKVSKLLSSVSALFSAFESAVKPEIEDILRRLELLLNQKDSLGLKSKGGSPNIPIQRIIAPLIEESGVYGRDDEKEAIVKVLLSDDVNGTRISVVPIVGMGGIGKTTLAQFVYYDKRVEEHFDSKAWLTISEEFDVLRITQEAFSAITSKKCDQTNLVQLQEELKKTLEGKKFLFIFDDVWNENYLLWDALKSPFESGAHGSKIIVTTRSTEVASKMGNVKNHVLKEMDKDSCWNLFKKHVHNANSELQEIGVEIVKKCKGLPLAVKSIAGLLRSTSDPKEWRKIQHSDIWELQFQEDQKNKIPPALWLSYHFLPPSVKRCFVYCSIFPKDFEFNQEDRERIVLLWMAEGLLQPQKEKRMEDVGEEYLNALISRSFFQSRSNTQTLVMHDLIHDLAIRMSGEFCFLSDASTFANDLQRKTIHLSCDGKPGYMMKLEGLSEGKRLRTFLALRYYGPQDGIRTDNLDMLLQGARGWLRMLSLSGSEFKKIPDSIRNLKYLRYLDLSATGIEEVPNSICTLYNLQTLLLWNCRNLKHLPKDLHRLINLRHLKIEGTSLKEMPPFVGNMKSLQILSEFVLSENEGPRIKELGDLQLHGSLCISGLDNVGDVNDASKANLEKQYGLEMLSLWWKCSKIDDTIKETEVLNKLQPHCDLKKLNIYGFRGTNFSDWVTHQSFHGIVEMTVQNCINCCRLPPFGQLRSLKTLRIGEMPLVESIGNEICGTSSFQPFPSLEKLWISGMSSWEKWSFTESEQGVIVFPCLKFLLIWQCEKLSVGLAAAGNCLTSLEHADIRKCDSMVSVIPAISQIDTIYPCLKVIRLTLCRGLESFSGVGLPKSLQDLNIWYCERLISNRLSWNLQRISALQHLDLVGYYKTESLDSFPEEGLLPSTLNCIHISTFKELKHLNGNALQRLTSLRQLKIWTCNKLQCLPEEGLPTSLHYLDIRECPLLSERCQRETGLDWPKIKHIPTIVIDQKEI